MKRSLVHLTYRERYPLENRLLTNKEEIDNSVKAAKLCHLPWKMCRITGIKKRKVNFGFKLQTEISSVKQNLRIIFTFLVLLFNTEERKKKLRVAFYHLFPLSYPKICIVSGKKWQNIPYLTGMSAGFLSQGWSLACPVHALGMSKWSKWSPGWASKGCGGGGTGVCSAV